MKKILSSRSSRSSKKPAKPSVSANMEGYETIALVLQGGGALGSYQAGVFEGLMDAGINPNWIAGISIGAINTALIAGNAPKHRVERLHAFWETICQPAFFALLPPFAEQALFNHNTDQGRKFFTAWQATQTLIEGQQGFFIPRFPPPPNFGGSDPTIASYYDTTPLKASLERLCDFDRINQGDIRVSIGAVNVKTGNFVHFENHGPNRTHLTAEHIMASGALPPGFPPVRIGNDYFWDGGLVSNTPLERIARMGNHKDSLIFQIDLWSAEGNVPNNMPDTSNRIKDIQYSSRTRLVTTQLQRIQQARMLLRELLELVPAEARSKNRWCQLARRVASDQRYNIVHLIYRDKKYESHYKDYQFGLTTMREHWQTGLSDIQNTLQHPEWLRMPDDDYGFTTYDIHRLLKTK